MLSLYFLILLHIPFTTIEKPSLDVSLIPEELLENANTVVRYEHTNANVVRLDKMYITKEKAITVLNEKGASSGIISIYYTDEVEKIKDLEVTVYNAKGEKIKKVKKKEINDLSVFDGFSIAQDARRKYYAFTPNSYPYTITYEYVKESSNTLYIPAWYPVGKTGVSVEKNTYNIDYSIEDYELMHKKKNMEHPSIKLDEEVYEFEATNFKAIVYEPKAPYVGDYFPSVNFIPKTFTYYETEGSFSNWKEYGKWVYENMLKGRGTIPRQVISEINALIPEGSSKDEIARIVYDYVTKSTRYVSIQLGVGGLKPFQPRDVYSLKYGDCKALSYYTAKILERYGIEAIYTEIMSERKYAIDYDEDLPGPFQGNHIVLCLPNEGDTTWLECTTGAYFFGYAHSGIDNRKALLITEEGGKLIKTKTYTADENLAKRTAHFSIGENEMVEIEMSNTFYNQRHESRVSLVNETLKNQKALLRKYILNKLPKYKLEDYTLEVNNHEKYIKESINLSTDKWIESAGNYMILPYMTEYPEIPEQLDTQRIKPIYIKTSKLDTYLYTIEIPEGYQIVDQELKTDVRNEFGKISFTKELKSDNTFEVNLKVEYFNGTFPANRAANYNLFAQKIKEIVNDKIILKPI